MTTLTDVPAGSSTETASASTPTIRARRRFSMSSSYPTGGYPLAALKTDDLADATILRVEPHGEVAAASFGESLAFRVDVANQKLVVLGDDLTEVANATDLSDVTNVDVEVYAD